MPLRPLIFRLLRLFFFPRHRSMVILLQDDLVDSCKAGDDVVRSLAQKRASFFALFDGSKDPPLEETHLSTPLFPPPAPPSARRWFSHLQRTCCCARPCRCLAGARCYLRSMATKNLDPRSDKLSPQQVVVGELLRRWMPVFEGVRCDVQVTLRANSVTVQSGSDQGSSQASRRPRSWMQAHF